MEFCFGTLKLKCFRNSHMEKPPEVIPELTEVIWTGNINLSHQHIDNKLNPVGRSPRKGIWSEKKLGAMDVSF